MKRAPLHKILVQSGTFLEPVYGFRVPQRSADITGNVSDGRRVRISDEGDPYRDAGRLCPVLRGVMGHHVFHHCVFRHVLHKVRLLKNNKRETLEQISAAVSSDLKIEV